MPHVKILVVALAGALALGGATTASAQSCPSASDIAGTWRWVESRMGGGDTTLTPESEGFELRLRFEEDGSAEIEVDSDVTAGSYVLECVPSAHTASFVLDAPDLKLVEPLGSALQDSYRLATTPVGELFLLAECLGCWSHTFVFDDTGAPVEGLAVGTWKARWADD